MKIINIYIPEGKKWEELAIKLALHGEAQGHIVEIIVGDIWLLSNCDVAIYFNRDYFNDRDNLTTSELYIYFMIDILEDIVIRNTRIYDLVHAMVTIDKLYS